jgi:uncharacterized protein YlxW (UPF0749 family)
VVTPLAFAVAGVLLVTSGVNAGGTDLRPGRYDDLADLARQETARVQALRDQIAALQEDVDRLGAGVESTALADLEERIARLEGPAGLTAVEGPGLSVTMNDAPEQVRETAGEDVSKTIVHQQDIQAVANAMWAGGAEAMTIQGQRVVSTTGIKCVGNTVLLHGVYYSPPYVISAIGDADGMRASLDNSAYIQAYLRDVDAWDLGWDVQQDASIRAPAFEGSTEMRHARVATGG